MNIVFLQTFVAIAETGSLVRAAEKMNVTKSAVTARLKALESDLGQVLFRRHKSGTTLTPAGAKLYRYARVMTGLWRQARHEAGLPAGTEAACTFGCHPELWYGPGRAFVDGLLGDRPEVALTVYRGSAPELEDWLAAGLVDVVMTFDPVVRGNQTIHPLPPERLILVSDRPDSPTKFDPKYVFVDHGEEYRRGHGEAYFDAGTARVSFDSSLWALQFLLERGGSAYLPEALVRPHLAAGRLHALPGAVEFRRRKHLVVRDAVEETWPVFAEIAARIG